VLFNPKKRELYAWAGEQGIKEGGGGAVMNLKDIINMFFGGAAAARFEGCEGRKCNTFQRKNHKCCSTRRSASCTPGRGSRASRRAGAAPS